ncbi:MAG: nucleotide exchange factor GrpE [Firmicutes bacterium]|nr:nucleotide exchange factor GrpE [Bacillota bacterium]
MNAANEHDESTVQEEEQLANESRPVGGDGAVPVSETPAAGVDPAVVLLQAEVEELRSKWLRVQADFDNFRKRTRQEREELAAFANAKLIGELLPVLDHFAMAVAAADAGGGTESQSLLKGVDMVYKQFVSVMENAGLRVMEPVGQPFDPNRHEAVAQEPVEGVAPGHVAQVLRTGYILGERVLRPAMVKISQ